MTRPGCAIVLLLLVVAILVIVWLAQFSVLVAVPVGVILVVALGFFWLEGLRRGAL